MDRLAKVDAAARNMVHKLLFVVVVVVVVVALAGSSPIRARSVVRE